MKQYKRSYIVNFLQSLRFYVSYFMFYILYFIFCPPSSNASLSSAIALEHCRVCSHIAQFFKFPPQLNELDLRYFIEGTNIWTVYKTNIDDTQKERRKYVLISFNKPN